MAGQAQVCSDVNRIRVCKRLLTIYLLSKPCLPMHSCLSTYAHRSFQFPRCCCRVMASMNSPSKVKHRVDGLWGALGRSMSLLIFLICWIGSSHRPPNCWTSTAPTCPSALCLIWIIQCGHSGERSRAAASPATAAETHVARHNENSPAPLSCVVLPPSPQKV